VTTTTPTMTDEVDDDPIDNNNLHGQAGRMPTNEQEIVVAEVISNFLELIGMKSLAFVSLHLAP
jgi:hypothetical protein